MSHSHHDGRAHSGNDRSTHERGSTHASPALYRRLCLAVVFTTVFVVVEAAAGYFSHSLALVSDAGHNLADALALALSWYGVWVGGKPADARRTFGSHRVSILAALANSLSLVVIALIIVWEALGRLRYPVAVDSGPMIVLALVAMVLNGLISLSLRHGAKDDLNLRSAYLHMLGDALSALGVVIAGIVIYFTGATSADPVVSFVIAALILLSSWSILVDAVNVLLEATPKGLDMPEVESSILGVEGVLNVHDLHVWTLASGIVAASCHIQVTEQSIRSGQQVLAKVVEQLKDRFSITHTTVQIEVEGCAPNDMYCRMTRIDSSAPGTHRH